MTKKEAKNKNEYKAMISFTIPFLAVNFEKGKTYQLSEDQMRRLRTQILTRKLKKV